MALGSTVMKALANFDSIVDLEETGQKKSFKSSIFGSKGITKSALSIFEGRKTSTSATGSNTTNS
jgi:hypothetical protein